MSNFFFEYGLFIAKVITGLIALVFVVGIIGGARKKEEGPELKVTNLNEKYKALKLRLLESLMDKKEYKQYLKDQAKSEKKESKQNKTQNPKPKLYVLDFEGDIKASQVETMRDEITALLSVAQRIAINAY